MKPEEKSTTAQSEEKILSFWHTENIFKKSMEKEAPQGSFVFYDGPPFATGLPHYGHLLAGTIKDIIPRYKTMQGYHVPRKWGWDCHGLPIENLIEKELDLATKKDIEDYGIEKFNQAARDSVLRYEVDWKRYVPRSGRWIDMDAPYMSMQSSYMESVWWIFSQLHTKGLTKEGFKSMHLCPRCETTLANFEVNQGYKDVTDISVTAKFALVNEPGTFLLAWTTTPWTLGGNVALAVGEEIEYVKISCDDERYILAKALVEKVCGDKQYEVVETLSGKDLVGQAYTPVFDYYQKQDDLEYRENGWKIYAADFVTTEDGTGIVHVAPGYGSDDMELGKENNLPFIQHVGKDGRFKDDFAMTVDGASFKGMLVKQKDDLMSADIEVIKRLAHDGNLFSKHKLVHSYPHCWRCDTPLLNYATGSWYLDVPELKENLIAANEKVNWTPDHIGSGRFGKWLEGARDWALSRSRFWGTPLPIWQNEETEEMLVIGSVDELLDHVAGSGNTYFGMRHGQSQSNVDGVVNADVNTENPLTEAGRAEVQASLKDLDQDIDYIFVSPFQRTQETAEIIKQELGLSDDQVIIDDRLGETFIGKQWEGSLWSDIHAMKADESVSFEDRKIAEDGESLADIYKRVMACIFDIEAKYTNKKILIISHGGVLKSLQFGISAHGSLDSIESYYMANTIPDNAKLLDLEFVAFPHNESYELDLHRPYIDEVKLVSKEGNPLTRIEDVFDVWFDSGSMPYAQVHHPFSNNGELDSSRFPAQFIAEGLDQTRGWFYVLSVLGMALFEKIPFENVIVNGLILAEDGKKMSKRLQNYPDPYDLFNSVGADAVRLYMIASPVVRAEEFAFSEKGVREVASKVMGRLRNVLSLFSMYKDDVDEYISSADVHVLDIWIKERLVQMNTEMTEALESYELDRAARPIFDFVDDFSTWYIRRSRDRFKGDDLEDKKHALGTTRMVLMECAKMIAPFTPFIAEELWQALATDEMPESVHLAKWPVYESKSNEEVISKMVEVREYISQALQLRSEAKIKVRQPLASVSLPMKDLDPSYEALILDELNVKTVVYGDDISLDIELTPELLAEGNMREFLRGLQSLRKEIGLDAHDIIRLKIQTDETGKNLLTQFADEIRSTAGVSEFLWEENDGHEITVDEMSFICSVV